jgi:tetratricopeptide (TPR) repeat protein
MDWRYLYEIGQFQRALQLLITAEKVAKSDPGLLASTLSVKAIIYHLQNRLLEARDIWQENLELRIKLNGPDHFLVAHNLGNLGVAYGELGDKEQCRKMFTDGHHHRLKNHPNNQVDLGRYWLAFACYLIHYNELDEAETTIQESLDFLRTDAGSEGLNYAE